MTEIYLNDNRLDVEMGKDATVGELISAIEAEIKAAEQIITSVSVDGSIEEDWKSAAFSMKRLCECERVDISSASLEAVIDAGINNCLDLIDHIKADTIAASEKIRGGKEEDGIRAVLGVYGLAGTLVNTVESVRKASLLAGREDVPLAPAEIYRALIEKFEELRVANNDGDMVLMTDILEYELLPVFDRLAAVFCRGAVSRQ